MLAIEFHFVVELIAVEFVSVREYTVGDRFVDDDDQARIDAAMDLDVLVEEWGSLMRVKVNQETNDGFHFHFYRIDLHLFASAGRNVHDGDDDCAFSKHGRVDSVVDIWEAFVVAEVAVVVCYSFVLELLEGLSLKYSKFEVEYSTVVAERLKKHLDCYYKSSKTNSWPHSIHSTC